MLRPESQRTIHYKNGRTQFTRNTGPEDSGEEGEKREKACRPAIWHTIVCSREHEKPSEDFFTISGGKLPITIPNRARIAFILILFLLETLFFCLIKLKSPGSYSIYRFLPY